MSGKHHAGVKLKQGQRLLTAYFQNKTTLAVYRGIYSITDMLKTILNFNVKG